MSKITTILIATTNRGKAQEIKKIFQNTNFNLKFLFDFPKLLKNLKIVENAKSFEGNALIKAIIVGNLSKMITLADDSGLVIDALNGRPGIFSARYTKTGNDKDNYRKVLQEMKGIPRAKRNCHYACAVAIYDPQTEFVDTTLGIWKAIVAQKPKGNKSFGYAPIILTASSNYQKTNAEFEVEDLIKINHRGQAFQQAIKILNKYLK